MFDIGFWEISLIFVLGLLILGPERLPGVARTTGLWIGKARGAMRKLQREVQRELMIEETRSAVEEARRTYGDATKEMMDKPVLTEAESRELDARAANIDVKDPADGLLEDAPSIHKAYRRAEADKSISDASANVTESGRDNDRDT